MTDPAILEENSPAPASHPNAKPSRLGVPKGRLLAALAGALFLAALPLNWVSVEHVQAGVTIDLSEWQLWFVASTIVGAAGAFTLAVTRDSRAAPPIVVLAAVPGLFLGFLAFFPGYIAPAGATLVPDYGAVAVVVAAVLAMWSGLRAIGRYARRTG